MVHVRRCLERGDPGFMPPRRGSVQIDRGGSGSGVFGALRAPATNRVIMQQGLPDLHRKPFLLLRASVIQFVTAKITS
jgi:hypothetical protein